MTRQIFPISDCKNCGGRIQLARGQWYHIRIAEYEPVKHASPILCSPGQTSEKATPVDGEVIVNLSLI